MTITVPFPPEEPQSPVVDEELRINRRNTAAFIDADPVWLALERHDTQRTASGGRRTVALPPLPAQKLRLIPANDRTPQVRTASGELETPVFTLLGQYSANMAKGDRFHYDGVEYVIAAEVRPQHTDKAYYRKGDVVRNRDAT